MEDNFDQDLINELADKWLHGTITEEEKVIYNKWAQSFDNSLLELPSGYAPSVLALRDRSHAKLIQHISIIEGTVPKRYRLSRNWWKIFAAAFISIVAFLIFLLVYLNKITPIDPKKVSQEIDVAAGKNKATLILSDGRKVDVENAGAGLLTSDSGIQIDKADDGQLIYQSANNNAPAKINTIVIPWGGQYRVQLPDGTKVWLNAVSTLKYSTSYTGMKERRVELIGEAYFEVAHNKKQPFIVQTSDQEVKVLGTHFNINSYADENRTVTTLAEGSVKVTTGGMSKTIRPGEQSIVSSNKIMLQPADLKVSLAWKDNKMTFKDTGIAEVMRQVSRWYNVKIEYQGAIPDDTITGTIKRDSNLSSVLKMFQAMEIKFTLVHTKQGNILIIKP